MGATIQHEKGGLWVLRVSGALRKDEMDAVQAECLEGMGPYDDAKVLVIVEDNFCGWMGGEVWNDMTFFVEHGDRIAKIAIIGDPKWESRMLMFAGAGFRRSPVKYFVKNHFAEAYAWLS
jgi:stage II sporulation SpoAA-like protein